MKTDRPQTRGPKWFTCTPRGFPGGPSFFTRDSGLLCKGFQDLGIECKAILLLPWQNGDQKRDLIRAQYSDLVDPEWWRSLAGTGVVFYGWGKGKHTAVASAIRKSGMVLISSIDSSGVMSPYTTPVEYSLLALRRRIAAKGLVVGTALGMASAIKGFIPSLTDLPRLRHLDHADIVTMVTPQGSEILKTLARRYKFTELSERIRYAPHPQLSEYFYDGTPKENIVTTVGRWDRGSWFQKRPDLILKSAAQFLKTRQDFRFFLVGSHVEQLKELSNRYCREVESRISFVPFIEPNKLKILYQKTKIAFWASRHEGQQNTGAQALCCGASVVATGGTSMSCFAHYCSRSSGRQAIRNNAQFLGDALILEANAWDNGERDPSEISRVWSGEFHANRVAERLLGLLD